MEEPKLAVRLKPNSSTVQLPGVGDRSSYSNNMPSKNLCGYCYERWSKSFALSLGRDGQFHGCCWTAVPISPAQMVKSQE